ncbi:MAG TPA: universal stress protein [Solirubrobacterales bacterium]|nr:universal stress protein [Solirubrobacterales bacterium]
MSRHILIGCDGSERSEDALALGAVLAQTLEAAPIAASIVPYSSYVLSSERADEVVERVSAPFLAMARKHLSGHEFETRAILNESAATGLHDLAESENAVLIVVGSSHRGAVGRVLLGSVGASLLTGAPCGVAIAPRGYAQRDAHSISDLVLGFDGSEEARGALEVAVALAAQAGARVSVTGAVEPVHPYFYPVTPFDDDHYVSELKASLSRSVDEAVELASRSGVKAHGELVRGFAADSLIDATAEKDLLVLGSRGFGPVKRTFMGSVSSAVMQRASCPVLVVPRGGANRLAGERAADHEAPPTGADETAMRGEAR